MASSLLGGVTPRPDPGPPCPHPHPSKPPHHRQAAAIPLPLVRQLLGPYLVFLCSTVNGYEGTGRSLSLKLIQQLRAQGAKLASGDGKAGGGGSGGAGGGGDGGATGGLRTFREVVLQDPIRWAFGGVGGGPGAGGRGAGTRGMPSKVTAARARTAQQASLPV